MDYEYAVDPKAIATDWKTFRFVFGLFGFEKGRLISRFPRNWFEEVYNAVRETEKLDPANMDVRIRNLDKIKKKLEEEIVE